MSTATASVFFAILALFAIAGSVTLAVALTLAARSGEGSAARLVVGEVGRIALPIAWLVATVTTLGSLYYSQIAHFVPCQLCWFQRIAVYPLALLLGIATFRRDRGVRVYVVAQCGVGAAIALYHSYIQAFPPVDGSSFCTIDAPCTARYVWEFGFVSLPFMAFAAFVSIIMLMIPLFPPFSPLDLEPSDE